jgi:NAD(P)-dependent dehydrogenase (short-subunit alcohol dehydrogenase family)
MTQKTWLITGSGNGLGRNIAEAALKAGVSGAGRRGHYGSARRGHGAIGGWQ